MGGGGEGDLMEDGGIGEWGAVVDEKDEADYPHHEDREQDFILALLFLSTLDECGDLGFGGRRAHQLL